MILLSTDIYSYQAILCGLSVLWGNTLFESKKCAWRGSAVARRGGCGDFDRPSRTHGKEVGNMNGISVEQKENKQESLKDKYMLTVKEAAFYFNIGTKKMRRIAEDNLGNIAVYSGNRFLIIRPKFEDFILNSSEI